MTLLNPASDATNLVLISIVSPDQVGLIAAVAGRLYDAGANLADTSFAVLGRACEFSCLAELPAGISLEYIERELADLPVLAQAEVKVAKFRFTPDRSDRASVTHIIEVDGGDRPGLIARLSEVLMNYDANVVRMNSTRLQQADGSNRYVTTFEVSIPALRVDGCLSAVHNTAGQLNLISQHRAVYA
jgi:glycine cleavage system transcriptional repressor